MKVEYQIIKRNDNFCKNENLFISLLETNKNYKIKRASTILKYKDISKKSIEGIKRILKEVK